MNVKLALIGHNDISKNRYWGGQYNTFRIDIHI